MTIDRIHFEERQYLRSYDWTAEQEYHLEMRRRLNMALHLWGIVDGLELLMGKLDPALPDQCFIKTGMAIDGYGREMVLSQPYVLADADIQSNRINQPGDYGVWITYRRDLGTPPAPGYRLCDVTDQYTRWHESSRILVTNNPPPTPTVTVADDLPDDPEKAPWLVRVGTVTVARVNSTLTFTNARSDLRTYVGVRAQHLVAPVASLSTATPDARLPISVEADLQGLRNLTVSATDVPVPTAKVIPAPTVTPFPTLDGNVKVGTDLFLRGEFYKYDKVKDQWLALKGVLQQLVPDTQAGVTNVVPVGTTVSNYIVGTATIPLTTTVIGASSTSKAVGVTNLVGLNFNNLFTWITNLIDPNAPPKLEVAATLQATGTAGNTWNLVVTYTVGPVASGTIVLPLQSFAINWVVTFVP